MVLKKSSGLAIALAAVLVLGAGGAILHFALPNGIIGRFSYTQKVNEERGLGGMVIVMANWWDNSCTETVNWDELTEAEYRRWQDRVMMENRHNFRIINYRYGTWQDVRDGLRGHIYAENRDIQAWAVEPHVFKTVQAADLLAPINPAHFDPSFGVNWNQSVLTLTTFDGMPHGFTNAVGDTSIGMYFNMRLLEEAGIPRELPFDLQAQGNWNWDTFTEILHALYAASFDDNRGFRSSWALAALPTNMFRLALASNSAAYALIDSATGHFVNATTTDAFRETVEWIVQLRREMFALTQYDVGGDVYIQRWMFEDGLAAFHITDINHSSWRNFRDWHNHDFEWGHVAFPTGPSNPTGNHYAWAGSNFNVFPHFYTNEEIDDFMFAIRAWNRPLYDVAHDEWMQEALLIHPNERSVYETMANFTHNPNYHIIPAHMMLPPGMTNSAMNELFAWRLWQGTPPRWPILDPSYIIESAQPSWQAMIDEANSRLGR